MRIVSEGGRTWGVIEEPLDKKHTQMQKVYVEIMARHMRKFGEDAVAFSEAVARRTQPHTEEPHGRSCTCFPCEQSNERMDRDDPSVGGYDPTN